MPLVLSIPARELFDESTSTIIEIPAKKLVLEHSLVSISKWESKWHKPYIPPLMATKKEAAKSREEELDYVRCMTIGDNVDPMIYYGLSRKNRLDIQQYINDPMTATIITQNNKKPGRSEVITSELIYYWMTALNIPFQPCEKWHLNRLLKLIEVCAIKNEQPKKMSPKSIAKRNHSLNAARRAKHHSKG